MAATNVDGGSTDACGIATRGLTPSIFDCDDVAASPISVTMSVTDPSGGGDSCVTTITVVDNEDPEAVCNAATLELSVTGSATLFAGDVAGGSEDECGIGDITTDPAMFDCADAGTTVSVLVSVTPNAGATTTCNADVTIVDLIHPTVSCASFGVVLDATTGTAVVADSTFAASDNDNCGVVTYTATQTTFGCGDIPSRNVGLEVADASGNTASCVATVSVSDDAPPVALCEDQARQFFFIIIFFLFLFCCCGLKVIWFCWDLVWVVCCCLRCGVCRGFRCGELFAGCFVRVGACVAGCHCVDGRPVSSPPLLLRQGATG